MDNESSAQLANGNGLNSTLLERSRKDRRQILSALRYQRLTLVVGAGVSKNAILAGHPKKGVSKAYKAESMLWRGFVQHGLNFLEGPQKIPLNDIEQKELEEHQERLALDSQIPVTGLLRAMTFVKKQLERRELMERFLEGEFENLHEDCIGDGPSPILDVMKDLHSLGARIATTNYDDLLAEHLKVPIAKIDNTFQLPRFFRRHERAIGHIHGVWWHQRGAIFDIDDYTRTINQIPFQQHLRNMVSSDEVVLFAGTGGGLDDPNFEQLLKWSAEQNQGVASQHFVLMRHGEDVTGVPNQLNVIYYGNEYDDLSGWLAGLARDAQVARNVAFNNAPDYLVEYFVDRLEVRAQIDGLLNPQNQRGTINVLVGMGGCGKTQMALKICALAKEQKIYEGILWIDATSPETADQAFASVAEKIPHVPADPSKVGKETTDAVLEYLKTTNGLWLLVFDNLDDLDQFDQRKPRSFWPPDSPRRHSILITSRHRRTIDFSPECHGVDMTTLTESEALKLLRFPDSSNIDCRQQHVALVVRLGYHALALDYARVCLEAMEPDEFLRLYDRERDILEGSEEILEYRRRNPDTGENSALNVFTALNLSRRFIRHSHGTTKGDKEHLLSLLAFLDVTEISSDLFLPYARMDPDWLRSCYRDGEWKSRRFLDIFRHLIDISYVHPIKSPPGTVAIKGGIHISVHPLVQDWIKCQLLSKNQRTACLVEAFRIICGYAPSIPEISFQSWQSIMRHADVVIAENMKTSILEASATDKLFLEFVDTISLLYVMHNRYETAIKYQHWVWKQSQNKFGPKHHETLIRQARLSSTYSKTHQFKDAVELQAQVVEVQKRAPGLDHPVTFENQAKLATLYREQGRFEDAKELEVQILETAERALGPEHPVTLEIKVGLIATYRAQRKFDDALELQVKVLELAERVHGTEHPVSLGIKSGLAGTYTVQGRFDDALELQLKVVEANKRVYGPEHADTILSQLFLETVRFEQGSNPVKEIMELLKRIVKLGEHWSGPGHPVVLEAQACLKDVEKFAGTWLTAS